MKKKRDQTKHEESNRREGAEDFLAGKSESLDDQSAPDVKSLMHEFKVHQLELEMQNEELRRAHLELEESRNRYADLYEFAPVGYFTLSENGIMKEVNLTGAALLGVQSSNVIRHAFPNTWTKSTTACFLHLKEIFSKLQVDIAAS